MNNKGFTLTEVLAALVIISIALIVVAKEMGKTLSVTKNESYSLMKNNIIKASNLYIKECDNRTIECNITWKDNKTRFKVSILKEKGYYNNFTSPIDNKELSDCLVIESEKHNGVVNTKIIDNCY